MPKTIPGLPRKAFRPALLALLVATGCGLDGGDSPFTTPNAQPSVARGHDADARPSSRTSWDDAGPTPRFVKVAAGTQPSEEIAGYTLHSVGSLEGIQIPFAPPSGPPGSNTSRERYHRAQAMCDMIVANALASGDFPAESLGECLHGEEAVTTSSTSTWRFDIQVFAPNDGDDEVHTIRY